MKRTPGSRILLGADVMATELHARITDQMLRRICSEYLEMPGLCLTLKQAQRLWDLDEEACREALQLLVNITFLCRADAGVVDLPPGSAIMFRRQRVAVQRDRRAATSQVPALFARRSSAGG